jgi:hypothetical protein
MDDRVMGHAVTFFGKNLVTGGSPRFQIGILVDNGSVTPFSSLSLDAEFSASPWPISIDQP